MTDWNKLLWGDPAASRRNILQRADRRGVDAPQVADDPVTGFLKGLSKYGPKHGAEEPGTVDATIARLGMSRSKVTDTDAALLHLYNGDTAMQTAILARIHDREGAATLVDDVAAAAGDTGGAAAEAVTGGGATSAWADDALEKVALLEPTERTAVLTDIVRSTAKAGATPTVDEMLEAAIRSAPTDVVQEAVADGLELAIARKQALDAAAGAVAGTAADEATGIFAAGKTVVKVAPEATKAAAEVPAAIDAAEHATEVVPTVTAAVEHAAPSVTEIVEHAAPAASHVADIVDLASHAGAVGDAAAAVGELAGHAGEVASHAGEVAGTATKVARAASGRLWSIDDMAREAMRLGPWIARR